MFPLLGSLITGGASLLGGLFSSNTSAENTQANIAAQQQTNQQQMNFNAEQAQLNRDFQSQQSNTAYQRASSDMQKAGLNPAMMFGSGSAASTPSGSTASASLTAPKSEKTSPLAGLGQAASQAVTTAVQMKTMDKMAEEMALLIADKKKTDAMTDLVSQQYQSEAKRTSLLQHEGDTEAQRTGLTSALRRAAEKGALEGDALSKASPFVRDNLIRWGYYGTKVSDIAAPLLNTAKTASEFLPFKSTREGATQFVRDKWGDVVGSDTFEKIWKGRIGK